MAGGGRAGSSATRSEGGVMATVGFVLAAGVLVAAVAAGAFLVARAIAEPAVEVTAAVLRWRETRREQKESAT